MPRIDLPTRRNSLRARGFDYTQSRLYFVTIDLNDSRPLLGDVVAGEMMLNEAGRMVDSVWRELPNHYPGVYVDAHQVMPDHLQGILAPNGFEDRGSAVPKERLFALSDIMERFKSLTTTCYRHGVQRRGWPRFHRKLWQRGFYDHIIRGTRELEQVRRYIQQNPARWDETKPAELPWLR